MTGLEGVDVRVYRIEGTMTAALDGNLRCGRLSYSDKWNCVTYLHDGKLWGTKFRGCAIIRSHDVRLFERGHFESLPHEPF